MSRLAWMVSSPVQMVDSIGFRRETTNQTGLTSLFATVDAHVIGRSTYEMVLSFGGWPYGNKPVFVLSTGTIANAPELAVVEQLAGSPIEIMSGLDKRGYRNVWVDGGVTVQRFIRQGLVHRFVITRVPVLIGDGIPFFGTTATDIHLKHVRTMIFVNGLVQSEYELQ